MRSRTREPRPAACFNADDNEITRALDALERPTFQRGGQFFTGVILSLEEFRPFEPLFFKLDEQSLDEEQVRTLIYEYTRAVFPDPRPWWRRIWKKAPATLVSEMSLPLQILAVKRFLACQTSAIPVWLGQSEPTVQTPSS
jgi:hypothetical protein